MRMRLAGPADADVLTEMMLEGIATYAAFAPAGWSPPEASETRPAIAARLGISGTWCLLAEDAEGPAGHVAFLPAVHARPPTGDSRLAHFWMLFVRERAWGSGVAAGLHQRAVWEARRRGYSHLRLFVAAGQARARRFYAREGWIEVTEPFDEERIGLPILECRMPLR